MSLIYTVKDGEGKVAVLCPECKKSIGIMSLQEVGELALANVQPLCFECDPDEPDTIPVHVVEFAHTWFLFLGDKVFLSEWRENPGNFCPSDISVKTISLLTYFLLKTGWKDNVAPLSSTLNLHKEPLIKSSELVIEGVIA